MESFVKGFAVYLENIDNCSLMKKEIAAARKEWRDKVLQYHERGSFTALEAIGALVHMPNQHMDKYIIPVRYPESDRPDWVDIVQFAVPHNTNSNSSLLEQEILEFYWQHDPDETDRLTRIESAFNMVAEKYGGTWCYLDQDVQPLEVE